MVSVLGIDPGMTNFGWGSVVVENEEIKLGLCGLISHPRDSAAPYNEYLDAGIAQICEQFPVLLSLVQPEYIVAEFVPPGRLGSRSELVVAAATAAKVIAFQWGIEWRGIGSNSWKKSVIGDATATKARIRNTMIDVFPSLGERHAAQKAEQKSDGEKVVGIPQDVFDSIAIAIAGAKLYANQYRGSPQDPERSL